MERAVRIMQEVSKVLIGKNDVIGKVMLTMLMTHPGAASMAVTRASPPGVFTDPP